MGTKYVVQSCVNKNYRIKSVIICAVLMIFSLTALGLMIYNIAKLRFGFAIGYIIGILLAVLYVFIRMNIAFSTNISADKKNIILTMWTNNLLPFKTNCSIPFIREFIPAKNKKIRIDICDINDIYIGTKSFISRNISDNRFNEILKESLKESDLKKVNKSDIFCVLTNNDIYFMSIDNFDSKSLCKIVQNVLRVNNMIEFHTGSKKYKVYRRY